MVVRLMLASAAALGLGAAALMAQPEPPAERVATRAEILVVRALRPSVTAVSCPVPAAGVPKAADI